MCSVPADDSGGRTDSASRHLGAFPKVETAARKRLSENGIANNQSPTFHARLPPFVNIWRGRVTTNSVNASTSLSTVIVPPCCFVTMS